MASYRQTMLFHPFTERIQSRREDGMCFLLPLQPLPRPCPLPGAPATFSICILTACAAYSQALTTSPSSTHQPRLLEWLSEHTQGPALYARLPRMCGPLLRSRHRHRSGKQLGRARLGPNYLGLRLNDTPRATRAILEYPPPCLHRARISRPLGTLVGSTGSPCDAA